MFFLSVLDEYLHPKMSSISIQVGVIGRSIKINMLFRSFSSPIIVLFELQKW